MKRMVVGATLIAALLLITACTQSSPSKEEGRQEDHREEKMIPLIKCLQSS